ncbi:hypothetical protein B0T10DRAFT_124147 [Thelonectria olida]|uniref:Transmembrane protein n=1 Tax=Thelonectria olida TaxID=1576542 RepID=A0A9P8WHI2_9HYPO|nr:hypothetical protein B0T10DRAFT_124147 [Thelonectria olida]
MPRGMSIMNCLTCRHCQSTSRYLPLFASLRRVPLSVANSNNCNIVFLVVACIGRKCFLSPADSAPSQVRFSSSELPPCKQQGGGKTQRQASKLQDVSVSAWMRPWPTRSTRQAMKFLVAFLFCVFAFAGLGNKAPSGLTDPIVVKPSSGSTSFFLSFFSDLLLLLAPDLDLVPRSYFARKKKKKVNRRDLQQSFCHSVSAEGPGRMLLSKRGGWKSEREEGQRQRDRDRDRAGTWFDDGVTGERISTCESHRGEASIHPIRPCVKKTTRVVPNGLGFPIQANSIRLLRLRFLLSVPRGHRRL